MATYGFLDILEEELDKNFPFDFEISWDKRNHAVEVSFLLEAQNAAGVEMVDEDGEVSSDDILFEEGVLDSMGTVELIVEIENRFDIRVPVTEFGRDDWNTANKIIAGIVELQNA